MSTTKKSGCDWARMYRSTMSTLLMLVGANQIVCAQSGADDSEYPVHVSPRAIPSSTFAGQQRVYGMQMSPNGRYAVAVYPSRGWAGLPITGVELRIMSIDGEENVVKLQTSAEFLQRVVWLDNEVFIAERRRDFFQDESLRPLSMRKEGSFSLHKIGSFSRMSDKVNDVIDISHVTPESNALNSIVHALPKSKGQFLLSYSPDGKSYPGVYKVDIRSRKQKIIVPPTPPFRGWLADADGFVRLGWGWDFGKLRMTVRPGMSETWRELNSDQLVMSGAVEPVFIEAGGTTMIVKSALNQGRFGLYRISLETGQMLDKLFEHSSVDVHSITVANTDQRLLSANFIIDRVEHHYFDEEFGSLIEAIGRALPDRSIQVLQISMDDRFLLLFISSEIYPGAYYRFDRETRDLLMLDEIRSYINPAEMSPAVRKTFFTRDGLEIDGYLTIPISPTRKNTPMVILPHANPSERDFMTFNDLVQFLASRGYSVFQPNYRGSSGYGYAFSSLAANGWGMEMQDDLVDAAEFLIDEQLAEAGNICIFGQNYAGYAALLGVIQNPDIFSCAIALSPVTDLPQWTGLVRKLLGDTLADSISGKRSDKELEQYSPLHLVEKLIRPVLIVHGTDDSAIPYDQSERFMDALEGSEIEGTFLSLYGGDNSFSDLNMKVRMLDQVENFLYRNIRLEQ